MQHENVLPTLHAVIIPTIRGHQTRAPQLLSQTPGLHCLGIKSARARSHEAKPSDTIQAGEFRFARAITPEVSMNNPVAMDRCLAFINCQLKPGGRAVPSEARAVCRAVTISRQAGCGALVVAEKLAARLQTSLPPGEPPWAVFDRNLMEKVLEDHNLPAQLARFLPEDRMTELQDIADELFGLRPASWTVIEQTAETILKLAELGRVIVIGRGANIVTARLPQVLHVRLVAPLAKRLEHCRTAYNMTERDARSFCAREDTGRERYLKKYFKADIADPLLYHLTINTGLVSFDDAARLIAEALQAGTPINGRTPADRRSPLKRD